MSLYRLMLAYDGTAYEGWQVQPGKPTIQGVLEDRLEKMAGERVRVIGAGRTDAGVHAHAQVAHFHLSPSIPPDGLVRGLNSMLPLDIRIREAVLASPDFHARNCARSKTYRYYLDCSPVALPFRSRFTCHYPYPLDIPAMRGAAERFLGERDFAAFSASSTTVKTTVRTCTVSRWFLDDSELVYEIEANGFLHHMVRNIVGTLLEVGRGAWTPEDMDRLFETRDRRRTGPTAPAKGLHLMRVDY